MGTSAHGLRHLAPEGNGIAAAPVEHTPYVLPTEAAADTDTVFAGEFAAPSRAR